MEGRAVDRLAYTFMNGLKEEEPHKVAGETNPARARGISMG